MYLLVNEDISYTDNKKKNATSNNFLFQNSDKYRSYKDNSLKTNLYKNNREGFLILDKINNKDDYNKLNINKLKFIIAKTDFK